MKTPEPKTTNPNRRQFLKKSALGAAVCGILPSGSTNLQSNPDAGQKKMTCATVLPNTDVPERIWEKDPRLDERGLFPEDEKTFVDRDFHNDCYHVTEIHFAYGEDPIPTIKRMQAEGRHVALVSVEGPTVEEAGKLKDQLTEEGFFTEAINTTRVQRKDAPPIPELEADIDFVTWFHDEPRRPPKIEVYARQNEIRAKWGLPPHTKFA